MPNPQCVYWLFGRGLSIGCNLRWTAPQEWEGMQREEKIELIKITLRQEMEKRDIDCSVIRQLLRVLEQCTIEGWRHGFVTTNWDHLLQREILSQGWEVLPLWLVNSHVFHLNGTVEELEDSSNRSPFLLEEDPSDQRCQTIEANKAYEKMIWQRAFVVVGMSFECETDKFLLSALGRVQDDLPIGESTWIVVNPDQDALRLSCSRITAKLPRATVKEVCTTLSDWLASGLPELQTLGALSF